MNNSFEHDNFDDVPTWLVALHGIVLSLLLLCSVVGNATVILLVIFHKNLHYRSIVVSLGLVAADSLVALEWNLSGLASTIAGEWPLGDVACTVFGTLHLCLLYVRWLEILAVTLDRFFIILSPFNYYQYSKPLQVLLTILAWIIPITIISTATALQVGVFRFRLTMTTCSIDCLGTNPCFSFYLGVFAVFVVVGGVIPTVLYSIMYCIGRRKRSSMKHALGTQEVETESSTTSSADSLGGSIPQPVRIPSKHNAKLKDSDKRALITFFIIFVTLLVTQIPIFITSGALRNTNIFYQIPLWVHFVAMYAFLLSPVLTPIVIMRNKDFRKAFLSAINRTRTMAPIMTKTQLRQFRRNSSIACTDSTSSGHIQMFLGKRSSLQMETVVEEELKNEVAL